ncbi:hypothetical protein LR48_Vigan07g100800 [Vigna angularis]|uniref:TFIIS N-terminal domain-containing protein n=1 Tax=Phaseolus angularis TaxID=3914 RepID=A0A0L9UXM1_PHAAN|nr:hypothetical protein LR48_Vigan07g100800 [Vigna angularis]
MDLEHHDKREHLKNSGIGNAVMFLSQSDEEINSNRKLANELIYKWVSNTILNFYFILYFRYMFIYLFILLLKNDIH